MMPSCPSQQQSPFFLSRARAMRNDHSHTLSPVHRNPVFDNTRWYGPGFRSPSRKRRAARNLRRNSWDRDEGYIHVVEYVRDSNYGLCPAVMAMTVRRFPLGMTIDDRGVARATSFSLLFFFNSLFPPLSPPVRWERKPDRGSLRPLWSSCNHLDVASARKRRDERETWGMDGEDRREPFGLTNPVWTCARNET